MVESSKGHLDEFEDDEEVGTHRGKSREKNRSKHSETEQRRRSKINERFQLLRNLIPLNDQKRDKASFLLEVIEYIQFLQEKLNTYEASYQDWSSEPKKLIPWKNDHMGTVTEGFSDADQIFKNGTDRQNSTSVSPSTMLHDPQSSLEPDIGSGMVYKTLDHLSGSASLSGPLSVQQSNVFGVPSQTLRESVSDIAPVDPESWQAGNSTVFVSNNTLTSREETNGPIPNSFSQGVLETLTQALQSSGVNMSQSSISVQIDVATPTKNGFTSISSGSKDKVNQPLDNQLKVNSSDKYGRAHKRLRIDQ